MPSADGKGKTLTPQQWSDIKNRLLTRISELFDKHQPKFKKILDESEGKKVGIAFGCLVNNSETSPRTKVRTRYSEVHTDEVDDTFDDPDQLTLGITRPPTQENEHEDDDEKTEKPNAASEPTPPPPTEEKKTGRGTRNVGLGAKKKTT